MINTLITDMKKLFIISVLFLAIASCKKSRSVLPFKTVLVFGNSITRCNPDPAVGWYGRWGMAASSKDRDFMHILEAGYKVLNPEVTVIPSILVNWEVSHSSIPLSVLDSSLAVKPDLVIVRLGENIQSIANLHDSFERLIDYIHTRVPKARIVITGVFWKNDEIDKIFSDVATSRRLQFIPLSHLDIAENKSFIGDSVLNEQGVPYKITHQGVADHPGDLGMERIASTIYSATVN